MTRTVILDLGNVLVPFDFRRGYASLQGHCSCPAEEIPKRLSQTDLVHRLESGLIEAEDFFQQVSALLGLRMDYAEFQDAWSAIFLPETLIPESMVQRIAEKHRLLLLSNTNAIHYEMLERTYPILKHFHGKVLSHEVRAMKPAKAIYDAVLALAQCEPAECFYADDVPAYVEAARGQGIDAVVFTGLPQLEQDLRARGVSY